MDLASQKEKHDRRGSSDGGVRPHFDLDSTKIRRFKIMAIAPVAALGRIGRKIGAAGLGFLNGGYHCKIT